MVTTVEPELDDAAVTRAALGYFDDDTLRVYVEHGADFAPQTFIQIFARWIIALRQHNRETFDRAEAAEARIAELTAESERLLAMAQEVVRCHRKQAQALKPHATTFRSAAIQDLRAALVTIAPAAEQQEGGVG